MLMKRLCQKILKLEIVMEKNVAEINIKHP
jgi:hypothetical protein